MTARYANITSTLALIIALGATSYAAIRLPANSVGGVQIRNNAVTGRKIGSDAITSGKVRKGGGRGDFLRSEATIVGASRPVKTDGNTLAPENGETFRGWQVTVLNPAGGVTTGIRPEVWVVCVPAPA